MKVINDVHQQFAEYFQSENLKPYLYLLSKKLSEGHICVDVDKIDKEELASVGYDNIINKKKLQKEPLVSEGKEIKPIVLFKDRLYLQRYFKYETIILDKVKELVENEQLGTESKMSELKKHVHLIKDLFKSSGQDTDKKGEAINWPLVAAITTVLNNFTIITGPPGTGKTTTVAKILAILYNINPALKVALAAPTGKAAARMAESLKNATPDATDMVKSKFISLEPYTIHRLLGTIKNSHYFKHDSENTLNYDVVIADESSMIDVALFAKLLDAIATKTKVILLGDKDQLASVEAGSLFGDLCLAQKKLNSFSKVRAQLINGFITDSSQQINSDHIDNSSAHPLFEHVIELKRSHRFSDVAGIGKFSKAIIESNEPAIKDFFLNRDEQVTIDTTWNGELFEEFISGYEEFITENDIATALQKLNKLRVLCVVREGGHGLYAINKKIEKYLQKNKLIRLTGEFYEHRPVMLTNNNYELQLFNGDIGIIRPDEKGDLKAWFESAKGELKSISTGYISNAETVYAMTIHKSQGSEFDEVLVSLPESENIAILTRELLYTAVTRAKRKVIVQGSEIIILQASKAFVKRGSGIIERFIN
ncbi:MAG: exodeoxyribonuclease V subunit alpha [Ginsengibacter sp.]